MVLLQHLVQDNPWWKDPEKIYEDTHLNRLENQPFTHEHSIRFNLRTDAVYINALEGNVVQ